VLSEGRVVEKGSFEELVSRPGGVFAKLAKEQEELLKGDRATIASVAGDEGGDSLAASGPVAAALEPPPASKKEGEDELGPATLARAAPLPREALGALRKLLGLQSDRALHLLLMVLFSGAACVGPSIGFYFLTEARGWRPAALPQS